MKDCNTINKSLSTLRLNIVQKCGLLLMYKTQPNMDERVVVFFTRNIFFAPSPLSPG